MKLKDKLFKALFFPFLIGIFFSILIVFTVLFYYSKNYLDKKSAQDIYNIEKKYSTININSINILLSNVLLKAQVGLQEQITFYQNLGSNLTYEKKLENMINDCVQNIQDLISKKVELSYRANYFAFWFKDKKKKKFNDTIEEKLSDLYQQAATFSQIIQSLYSVIFSMNDILYNIYFLSESTGVFIGYPYIYFYNSKLANYFYNFSNNPSWCTDEEGNLIDHYKFQCRDLFKNILRVKEGIFDLNVQDQPHRKIFISSPYYQLGYKTSDEIFTMCIQFNDSISHKNAYMCGDIKYKNLFDSFDSFNDRLTGYFSIVNI